jgi:hypothetical protein
MKNIPNWQDVAIAATNEIERNKVQLKDLKSQRDEALDLLGQLCMDDSLQTRAKILSLKLKVQTYDELRS